VTAGGLLRLALLYFDGGLAGSPTVDQLVEALEPATATALGHRATAEPATVPALV